jgi:hypothetical protein
MCMCVRFLWCCLVNRLQNRCCYRFIEFWFVVTKLLQGVVKMVYVA